MPIDKQKEIFKKNLAKYVEASEKTQKEIAAAVGVSPQTFNTWIQGIALPRMDKIQALADYFKIRKSDLIDEKADSYYITPEVAQLAQEILEDPALHALFDAAKDVTTDDLRMASDMLKRFRDTNPDG